MKKTGFLFLNNPHHIYHAASIAFELSCLPGQEVVIYTSTSRNFDILNELSLLYPKQQCTLELILPSVFYRLSRYFKDRTFPGYKSIFNVHLDKFLSCDQLVSPGNEILGLREISGFKHKTMVYTRHGAGDGDYGFEDWIDEFDLVLLAGHDLKERLESKRLGSNTGAKLAVCGYPKFDLCSKINEKNSSGLFPNERPTVLYNPHFKQELSSWGLWGEVVLQYFKNSTQFNLIFAPHLNFFNAEKERVLRNFSNVENIHIDVDINSKSLVNMRYLYDADVYLGDVSSQVYEFLIKPRPCIFLNAHNVDWRDDLAYKCWQFGEVVEEVEAFDASISRVIAQHGRYLDVQQKAFQRRFHNQGENNSLAAAEILSSFNLR